MKFEVQQDYSGTLVREIEAENASDAERQMISMNQEINLEDMINCDWDNPVAIENRKNCKNCDNFISAEDELCGNCLLQKYNLSFEGRYDTNDSECMGSVYFKEEKILEVLRKIERKIIRLEGMIKDTEIPFKSGYKAGITEVIEWFTEQAFHVRSGIRPHYTLSEKELEDKVKEWGK